MAAIPVVANIAYIPLPDLAPERRRVQGDVAAAKRTVEEMRRDDPFTVSILHWFTAFTRGLDVATTQYASVQEIFLGQLKESLESETTRDLCLGTDNKVHSRHVYTLFLQQAVPAYRNRSPLNPGDRTPFSVSPHPVVVFLKEWLSDKKIVVAADPEEEAFYRDLPAMQKVPEEAAPVAAPREAPSPLGRALEGLLQRRRQTEAERQAAMAQFRERLQEEGAAVRAPLDRVHERIEANAAEREARMRALEQRTEEQIRVFRERIRQLDAEITEHAAARAALERDLTDLRADADNVRREQAEIRVAIQEAEKAIKEGQKNNFVEICVVIGIVVACILLPPAAPAAAPAAGAGGAAAGGAATAGGTAAAAGSSTFAVTPALTTTSGGMLTKSGAMVGGKTASSSGLFLNFAIPW